MTRTAPKMRDDLIIEARKKGLTIEDIALAFRITKQRVSQILQEKEKEK